MSGRIHRTTVRIPKTLFNEAARHGITNITAFLQEALEAVVRQGQTLETVATRHLQQEIAAAAADQADARQAIADRLDQAVVDQAVQTYIEAYRYTILRHLAQYGTVGRKAVDRIRADLFQQEGLTVQPAALRSALAVFAREAHETGAVTEAKFLLDLEREEAQYGDMVWTWLVAHRKRTHGGTNLFGIAGMIDEWDRLHGTDLLTPFAMEVSMMIAEEKKITVRSAVVKRVIGRMQTNQKRVEAWEEEHGVDGSCGLPPEAPEHRVARIRRSLERAGWLPVTDTAAESPLLTL